MSKYKVTVKGTVQLNGPVSVNKSIIVDERQAQMYTGAKRYDAIEGFLKVHYPGCRIPNIRNFGVEVKPL